MTRATTKWESGSPLLYTKWRRLVKPGKAEHPGHSREPVLIRINEEHTISTVMDGEDERGCETHLEQLAYPRFLGISPQIHRAARYRRIKEPSLEEYGQRCCSRRWHSLLLHCMSEHEREQAGKARGPGIQLTSLPDTTREGILTTILPQFRTPTRSTRQSGSPSRANG